MPILLSSVFIVNIEYISHLFIVFLLFSLNKQLRVEILKLFYKNKNNTIGIWNINFKTGCNINELKHLAVNTLKLLQSYFVYELSGCGFESRSSHLNPEISG